MPMASAPQNVTRIAPGVTFALPAHPDQIPGRTVDHSRWRGIASPDDGDALALTFAYPVAKRDWAEERRFDEALQKLKRWVV
jgi:hypothetical protein